MFSDSLGDFEKAIRNGYAQSDNEFLQMCRDHYYMDGSTGATAMLVDNKLIVAHCGKLRTVKAGVKYNR